MEPAHSFNLTKFKGRARRAASRDATGIAAWSPFRRFHHRAPRRNNTDSGAELGEARRHTDLAEEDEEGANGGAGQFGLQRLAQRSTAPDRLQPDDKAEQPAANGALLERKEDEFQQGLVESPAQTRQNSVADVRSHTPLRRPDTAATGSSSGQAAAREGMRARGTGNTTIGNTATGSTATATGIAAAATPAGSASPETTSEIKEKPKVGGMFKHLTPKEPFTLKNQLQRTFLSSWINILALAAPAGIALAVTGVDGKIVFAVNFIAIIPLAALLGFATEEIALRTGETLGGLINATFGNAVELIVAVIALIHGEIAIVQTSLIGSILSNLLLVLGMCFFCGGINRPKQKFNTVVAQTAASLLALAAASAIVPTVFSSNAAANKKDPPRVDDQHVAALSRGVSVILLIVYGAYLFFQLKTHRAVYNEASEKIEARPLFKGRHEVEGVSSLARAGGSLALHGDAPDQNGNGALAELHRRPLTVDGDDDDDDEEPQLHFLVAIGTLAGSTVLIGICAEFMVDGIHAVTVDGGLSEEFVGLILLPIVGNAAEHATAVTVAIKDKMDLAIGVAVGSSMQVALFLIPLLVVIGWIMGNEAMTLAFDTFQVAVMFVAVLLVNYLIADGESHWLEGFLLMMLYAIVAVCSWWYPTSTSVS